MSSATAGVTLGTPVQKGPTPKQGAPTQVTVDISKGTIALQTLQSQINGLRQTAPGTYYGRYAARDNTSNRCNRVN